MVGLKNLIMRRFLYIPMNSELSFDFISFGFQNATYSRRSDRTLRIGQLRRTCYSSRKGFLDSSTWITDSSVHKATIYRPSSSTRDDWNILLPFAVCTLFLPPKAPHTRKLLKFLACLAFYFFSYMQSKGCSYAMVPTPSCHQLIIGYVRDAPRCFLTLAPLKIGATHFFAQHGGLILDEKNSIKGEDTGLDVKR